MPAATALQNIVGLAGGRSLRARAPVMVWIKIVEALQLLRRCRKAILFTARRSIAEMARVGEICVGHNAL